MTLAARFVGRASLWIRYKEYLFSLLVFLGALLLYSLDWHYSLSNWNFNLVGGVSTIGAERILSGQVPYRDFWTMYAPGHFYLLALLYKVFGTHLMVEVVAASVVMAGSALLLYRLAHLIVNRYLLALASSAIFVAATYNTGYFKRIGSYPLAIFLILLILLFLVHYFQENKLRYLLAAGLTTGALIIFKHDVGGYTVISIFAGLATYHHLTPESTRVRKQSFLRIITVFSVSLLAIVLPVLIPFVWIAGKPMLADLVIFPLTDFRFARPETYPSILPIHIYNESPLEMMNNLSIYVYFLIPFLFFLLGLVSVGLSIFERNTTNAAIGVTLSVGFLIHYVAAHIQINTHIITMSVYSALSALLFYDALARKSIISQKWVIKAVGVILVFGWILALSAKPVYREWENRRSQTSELQLAKVSGFRVSTEEAQVLNDLSAFVVAQIPANKKLFVGLHRHDVIVIGDIMVYFILDHPIATRYHELHPAISDTAPVQQEIIKNLEENDVSLIIQRHIFSDEVLDNLKNDFLKNLPQVGATDLDHFIQRNYVKIRTFGPYEVMMSKETNLLLQ